MSHPLDQYLEEVCHCSAALRAKHEELQALVAAANQPDSKANLLLRVEASDGPVLVPALNIPEAVIDEAYRQAVQKLSEEVVALWGRAHQATAAADKMCQQAIQRAQGS